MSMREKNHVYLLNGSNQGNRADNLLAAQARLCKIGQITSQSHMYLTKAWGNVEQPDHYNQALSLLTALDAHELMQQLLDIECDLGRKRSTGIEPRTIDLDILFYNDLIEDSRLLKVPHPRLAERNFVLVPMLEIAPQLRHPVLKKTIEELYLECPDNLEVLMLEHHG